MSRRLKKREQELLAKTQNKAKKRRTNTSGAKPDKTDDVRTENSKDMVQVMKNLSGKDSKSLKVLLRKASRKQDEDDVRLRSTRRNSLAAARDDEEEVADDFEQESDDEEEVEDEDVEDEVEVDDDDVDCPRKVDAVQKMNEPNRKDHSLALMKSAGGESEDDLPISSPTSKVPIYPEPASMMNYDNRRSRRQLRNSNERTDEERNQDQSADMSGRSAQVENSSRTDQQVIEVSVGDADNRMDPNGVIRTASQEMNRGQSVAVDLNVDESVVVNLIKASESRVMDLIRLTVSDVVKEVKKGQGAIGDLQDEVNELNGVVTATASMMFSKQNGITSKSKELQKRLFVLPSLFNDKFMSIVMARVYVGYCLKEVQSIEIDRSKQEEVGCLLLSIMFFSKQPGETKKEKYGSRLGQQYCRFRHGILLTSFMAMQSNSFGTFKHTSNATGSRAKKSNNSNELYTGGDDDEINGHSLIGTKMIQPFWLKPGYVSKDHCLQAAVKSESRRNDEGGKEGACGSQTEDTVSRDDSSHSCDRTDDCTKRSNTSTSNRVKATRGGNVTRTVLANEAASLVYRIITNSLHRGRDAAKIQLFHEGLYLFSTWSKFQTDVDQRSLTLKWKKAGSQSMEYLRTLPDMTELPVQDRISESSVPVEGTDRKNMSVLSTFIQDHQEMLLIVEHDVYVESRIIPLRYYVNLFELVSILVSSFCSMESYTRAKNVLSVDKSALRMIVTISLALRELIDKTTKDVSDDGSVKWANGVAEKKRKGGQRVKRPRAQ